MVMTASPPTPTAAAGIPSAEAALQPRPRRIVPIWCKPFEEMVRERTRTARETVEYSERRRTRLSVTMFRRFRGDYFGFFSTSVRDRLVWRDPPSGNLKNYPLFGPVVRANNRSWLDADIDLEWEASSADPEMEGGAKVCQSVYEHLNRLQWTNNQRTQMCEYAQLAFNYFVHSYFDPTEDTYTHKLGRTQELERQPDVAGEYICPSCYSGGPAAALQDDACPKCGAQGLQYFDDPEGAAGAAPAAEEPRTFEAPAEGYDEQPAGDNCIDVVPSFLVRLDEVHAKGCDLSKAQWLNYHPLRYRYEIEAKIPNLQTLLENARYGGGGGAISAGTSWSESTEWWHALETSTSTPDLRMPNRTSAGASPHPDDLLEEDHWYWSAAAWEGYVFPEAYELLDHTGEIVFAAEAGETIREAFAAVGKEYRGLYLYMLGGAILWVDSKEICDEWSSGGWLQDASSFWCKAQEDLLDFQEAVNEWMTLFFEHGMHNALPHLVVDGQMFDGMPFRNQPDKVTKTRYGLVREKPISDYIHEIKAGQIGSDSFAIFAGTLQGAKDTTGVQDSTVGKSDPTNQTMGGKVLERNQSVSLLVPAVKLNAACKIETMLQQLRFAQAWPDERLLALRGKWGDEWKQEDIKAFRRMNLRRDVLVSIVEGTDMPLEADEKFMRILNLYQSMILTDPAVPEEIRALAVKYCGLDLDLGDFHAERRSAQSRLRKIDELCRYAVESNQAWVEQPVMEPVVDPATGQPAVDMMTGQPMQQPVIGPDGMPQTEKVINPAVLQAILSRPGIEILPRQDNHLLHIDVYNDRIRAIAADEPVDVFKMRVLQARVDEHYMQLMQNKLDEAAMMNMIGQAGGAGQEPGADPEAEAEGKLNVEKEKGDQKKAEGEHKSKEADKDRSHDVRMQRMKDESARAQTAIKSSSDQMRAKMQAANSKRPAQSAGKKTLARAGA